MKDVAAHAGVSVKTVSRVINAEKGVATATAQAVRQAIADLGYQADLQAQSLRRRDRRSRTVGLLVSSVANPFDSAVHAAVEEVADKYSTVVLAVSSANNVQLAQERAAILASRQIDGLIFSPSGEEHKWLPDLFISRPLVAIDRSPESEFADSIISDNQVGAMRAVRHLLSQGHRRIAFLGDNEQIQTAQLRKAGYLAALAEAKISPHPHLMKLGLVGEDAARLAVHELLTAPQPPTAIFAAQNQLTAGTLYALQELGLEEKMAVVSFDDLPNADLFKVGLTAITQNPVEIGRVAAERLFGRLSGEISGPPEKIIVPTGFKIRGSGEIPPLFTGF